MLGGWMSPGLGRLAVGEPRQGAASFPPPGADLSLGGTGTRPDAGREVASRHLAQRKGYRGGARRCALRDAT
jgi:hypothetical protein